MKNLLFGRTPWMHILLATALLMLGAGSINGASVTLAWDPNPEPDIAGYRVYYGTSSNAYSSTVDAGIVPTASLTNLTLGTTYYIVVTAYNSAGLESLPSGEISFTPISDPLIDADADGLADSWETLHGLNAADDGSGSSVNGASGDPDADGISNLIEYAFGLDPQGPEPSGNPGVRIINDPTDGLNYLTVSFNKRLDANGLTYTILSSSDCRTWNPAMVEAVGQPAPSLSGDTALFTYRITPALGAGTPQLKAFVRVAVSTAVSPSIQP